MRHTGTPELETDRLLLRVNLLPQDARRCTKTGQMTRL